MPDLSKDATSGATSSSKPLRRKPGSMEFRIEFLSGYETADAEIEAMFMESILADEPRGPVEY